MWTTLIIVTALFLIALRVFLTAHNQTEVISAGLVATACLMIAIGASPLALKVALLASILLFEQWLLHRQIPAK
ncbi:hypothetical protein N836_18255 [Leptolyngbya sp. Heron Island J]|uniref:hypothetical protein n=1 Tax=Leptolyngbya sp. Heron Island J TaxID=1385935 RepID=UPI0003B9AC1F|nr:hypothetical protein [Leptolyngbya sp. Heron Island J]ESA34191.1 hypothetical protein N836_18255 [Leptolyngbya sp. Heron Island J]